MALYWTFEVDESQSYLLTGDFGDGAYSSVSVYVAREKWHDTEVAATLEGHQFKYQADGSFELQLGGKTGQRDNWLPLPPGSRTVWIRQFYNDIHNERHGWVNIDNLGNPPLPAVVDEEMLAVRLRLAGRKVKSMTNAVRHAATNELPAGNHVRTWREMHDGAIFTSADIWYQRGAWSLAAGEALVLEGFAPTSTFWNIVLYSRFLNSLEHRFSACIPDRRKG